MQLKMRNLVVCIEKVLNFAFLRLLAADLLAEKMNENADRYIAFSICAQSAFIYVFKKSFVALPQYLPSLSLS